MLQYAHLAVQLDLQKAMGEVKEACENIQRTTEHVRRKAEGMDIHAMMQRQERLCMSRRKCMDKCMRWEKRFTCEVFRIRFRCDDRNGNLV